ncbi:MAG: hypothetical protein ACTHN4_01960 [Sphingomicrobium sp.]
MQKLLLMVAAFGICAPATAQTTPVQAPSNQSATAPAPQQKTVKKRVCEKVEVEQSTGSRLNSTTRICKTVEVPVTAQDGQPPAQLGSSDRH